MRRVVIPFVLLLGLFQSAFAQIQLLQNGGFENTAAAPWILTGAGVGIGNALGYAEAGQQYLDLGENLAGITGVAYQTVTFPTNLIAATLSLDYATLTSDTSGSDTLSIYVTDTNQPPNILFNLGYTSNLEPTPNNYVFASTNFIIYPGSNTISSLAGQSVEVYFFVQTDPTYGDTSFLVDNVSLVAATTTNIPVNDNFANAIPIPSAGITNTVTTTYASKEPGEPEHAGNVGGHSVWWTWTAPAIGTVTISTYGSQFDTLLGVYTGSAVSDLTTVVSNNGATRSTGLASVTFNVASGTQYDIALDGYNGEAGVANLFFRFSTDTTVPSIAVSYPTGATNVISSSALFKGTAKDNVAVAVVEYALANANGTNAFQVAASTNQWTNWSVTVTNLIPGTNLVTIAAFDTSSNLSLLATRLVNYDVPTPLSLAIVGRGTVSGATNGQFLNLTYPYTLIAKTNGGFAFKGWTGSIVTNTATLKFIMASNLSLTANFADVQKPVLSITAPKASQRWSNSLFEITGKASDNVAVAAVYYQLNNAPWTNAATADGTWSNWTASVTLTAGTNVIRAYAVDTATNFSATNTVTFDYVLTAPLIVQTNGRGTVSPNDNGQALAIGTTYSLTATAAAGFAFTEWTGSFLTNKAKLTFTMASNLTLIANFVDITKPTLSVTTPTANFRASNGVFTVNGKAGDNVAVANVFCQLNGSGFQPAQTQNNWTNWTTNLTLSPGPNVLQAYAEDGAGNLSATNKITFVYVPSATLTVQTNGLGGITPVENGKLLAIGTNYTLTATPGTGWIFSNWVASGGENFISNSPALKFTMQSNLVLQANFVPNPFIPLQGTFNGLFLDPTNVTGSSSGFFTLTLTTSGTFTGKIMTSGGTYNLPTTTKFSPGGGVEFAITTKQTTLTFNLQLDITNTAAEQITGTVFDGTQTAGLTADRAIFNATTNKAANYAGTYTVAIPSAGDAASPGGNGCGTVSITTAGQISLAGNLADGAVLSQSVPISQDGRWPFYAAYPAAPAGNGGAIFGWITFSNLPASTLGGNLNWFRPAGKTPALYQSGFTNLAQPLIGSAYNPAIEPPLSLTSGQITLSGGNLSTPIINSVTFGNGDTIAFTGTHTNGLTLKLTAKTGALTGTFLNPANTKQTISFNAVLLQNQNSAQGYFLGATDSGSFILDNP